MVVHTFATKQNNEQVQIQIERCHKQVVLLLLHNFGVTKESGREIEIKQ